MQSVTERVVRLLIEVMAITALFTCVGGHRWWGWVIYVVATIAVIEGELDFTTTLVRRLRKDK